MRSRRSIWTAGALFAAHEALLHSPPNQLLEQGGLFGQDLVQDILHISDNERFGLIPALSSMIYDKLGRPVAVSLLEMLTARHDPRIISGLLDRFRPSTFCVLLEHVDEDQPGLTDGIRVILSMASVQDQELQWRFIETLIRTGAVDRIIKEILVTVPQRSGKPVKLRQWLVQNPADAIQFVRERESAIQTFTNLMSNPRFCELLSTNFDLCFFDPQAIRRLIENERYPGAGLIELLSKSAIGAIGKRNAAKARILYLSTLPEDDPQRKYLAGTKSKTKGGMMLSFVTPQYEHGKQITFERMKLAGSLGSIASVVGMIIGRRQGSILRNFFRTGLGSALFVLCNDVFINWDRFFFREVFPIFDRSTEEGRRKDFLWSSLCSCAHIAGNVSLYALFPGSFLPYLLISSSHFRGELYALSFLTGTAPPPHLPRISTRV